jgi:hypothetical protein
MPQLSPKTEPMLVNNNTAAPRAARLDPTAPCLVIDEWRSCGVTKLSERKSLRRKLSPDFLGPLLVVGPPTLTSPDMSEMSVHLPQIMELAVK